MSKISVLAKITCASGKREEVAAAFDAMLDHVESEPGTELYVLHDDLGDPDVLWVYELYTDQAALDAHSSSSAMMALFGALGGELMGAPPELMLLTPRRGKSVSL
jgi:quinol monooxygenase YgiN